MGKRRRIASEERMARSDAAPSVEIRVHGIGDHKDWSQLGSPELVVNGTATKPDGPDVALPPENADHELRLLNWSRTNRRRTRGLWYPALPYTLVNAAAHMSPKDRERRPVPWTVALCGLILTVTTYVWAVAIAETVTRAALPFWAHSAWSGPVIAVLLDAVLTAAIAIRYRLLDDREVSATLAFSHVVALAAATLFTIIERPAQHHPVHWHPGLFVTEVASDTGIVRYWDPVTIASVVAIGLVVLLILIDVLRCGWSATCAGRAMALLSSVLLLISVASAVRLFLDNALHYLVLHHALPQPGNDPFHGRVMLAALRSDTLRTDDFVMDLLPLTAITAVIALAVAFFAWNLPDSGRLLLWLLPKARANHEVDRARCVHRLVTGQDRTLGRTVAFAAGIWAALLLASVVIVERGYTQSWQLLVIVVQVLSGVVALVVVAGRRFEKLGLVFGMLADLVGFWPVIAHPLGGASYRDRVVSGIHQEIAKPRTATIVLVGHSQGSVLGAWAVRHLKAGDVSPESLVLVTCGSPLRSLYAVFFPAHFDDEFFAALNTNASRWANFWRATDPIATEMRELAGKDVELVDPGPGQVLLGHGDYWIDPEQMGYIAERIAEGPAARRGEA